MHIQPFFLAHLLILLLANYSHIYAMEHPKKRITTQLGQSSKMQKTTHDSHNKETLYRNFLTFMLEEIDADIDYYHEPISQSNWIELASKRREWLKKNSFKEKQIIQKINIHQNIQSSRERSININNVPQTITLTKQIKKATQQVQRRFVYTQFTCGECKKKIPMRDMQVHLDKCMEKKLESIPSRQKLYN